VIDGFRHLLLIVETGTFTEAARRAHLSQPAISASIRRLEEALGARLLDRGPGGVRLTAAGQAVLPHAQAAIAAVEDAGRAAAEVVGLVRGEVRLGAGPTPCTYILPPLLAAFRRAHPGVRVRLRIANNEGVWDALRQGRIDLAIVSRVSVPATLDWAEMEPWQSDELVLVASPSADDEALREVVTYPRGSVLRRIVDERFPELDIAMELGSISATLAHVREGIGVALVSRICVEQELAAGELVAVPDARLPISRRLVLVHRGLERLPPAAVRLREVLHEADRVTG
jgi:DNA-binding transcriptional LysR family regulator